MSQNGTCRDTNARRVVITNRGTARRIERDRSLKKNTTAPSIVNDASDSRRHQRLGTVSTEVQRRAFAGFARGLPCGIGFFPSVVGHLRMALGFINYNHYTALPA
jgi:hypothetical protein